MKCKCLICKFENPKLTVTAVVIRNGKFLVAKRAEEPFKGWWDFIGGYLNKNEIPEVALQREVREELGARCALTSMTYIGAFPDNVSYAGYEYPVLSFAYLVELDGKLIPNKKELAELKWVPLRGLKKIAFDSNMKILERVKKNFNFDVASANGLMNQLDPSAQFNEQSFYKAALTGHVEIVRAGRKQRGKIIGMGWIFPRQTALRKQAVIEDMIVDARHRGRGIGEKILRRLIKWARLNGIEVIELTTNPARVAANNLYKKAGFKLHKTNHYLLRFKS